MDTILYLQQFASPTLDALLLFVTNLGSELAYIAFLLVTYLAFDARLGQRVAVYLLVSFYLNFHLKGLIDTPRPYTIDPELARSPAAVATGAGPGFPSGHAQASATFWGYLALRVRKIWFWTLAALLVALISLSRIYLGVHIPLDIIGGLIIGAVLVGLFLGVDRWVDTFTPPSKGVLFTLGLLVPLALHLFLSTPDSEVLMGGLAAFATAPLFVPYRAEGRIWRRVLVTLLGLVLVFAALFGSSLLLSEEVKRNALVGFVRYFLIGYTGLALTPYLAKLTHLTPTPPSQPSPKSTT